MRGKSKSVSLASTFLILAVMTFSLCNVQGIQATPPLMQSPLLIPPPPSAPYWTYKTDGAVRAVAVSEDGSTIVAGSYDNKIYVFGRGSNTTLWTYTTSYDIYSVAVSANGSTIVAGGNDNYVRVFGRQNNETIWAYNTGYSVYSVAVSADGNTVVAGGYDDYVHVFGRQNNETIWNYYTDYSVRSVAVSADGNTVVAGGYDYYVHVFGRQNNETIWNYYTDYSVRSVAVSADGNTVVAGGADDYVHVFGRQNNETIWNYLTADYVLGVAISRDGTTIVAGGYDGYLRVFGRTSNATLVQSNTGGTIYRAIAVASDGSTIACGNAAASPKAYLFSKSLGLLWDFSLSQPVGASITPGGPAVGISGDGSLIAYGCDDYKLYVFQYDTTPPVLGTPSALPSSPVGGQSVNISISVTDNVAVSTVTLYYKDASASSWSSAAMSLAGSVYRARIGPFATGSVIAYYVTAADTSGNNANSPADAPAGYHTFTVGSPPGIEWTSVLIGGTLGAVIAIIVSFLLMRGKRSRR